MSAAKLTTKGVVYGLEIKAKEGGAWIRVNNVIIGLSIKPDIQYFYLHVDGKSSTLLAFWQYREMIKLVAENAKIKPSEIDKGSIRALVQMHDSLIESHLPPNIWMLLKAEHRATGAYVPHPETVLSKLSAYAFKDVQSYKFAAALLKQFTSYEESARFIFEGEAKTLPELIPLVMDNWRGMLAPSTTGERRAYPALNKTMDDYGNTAPDGLEGAALKEYRKHFPLIRWMGKIPANIFELRRYKLEKALAPEQVRLLLELFETLGQLNGTLRHQEKVYGTDEIRAHWAHVIQNAPVSEIKMLIELDLFARVDRRGGARTNPYKELLVYLRDGARMSNDPFIRYSSLYSMFRASHTAHLEQQRRDDAQRAAQRQQKLMSQKEWMSKETAKPPAELPDAIEGGSVRFLQTVYEIHLEGDDMRHCIATYDSSAVSGSCYLYHVEYKGQMASVEISPTGQLRQIKGPKNTQNLATEWGGRFFIEWLKTW